MIQILLKKAVTWILFFGTFLVLLLTSCGNCDYDHNSLSDEQFSYVVLADTTDTISSIRYDAKQGLFYPNSYYFPLLISYTIPTWVTVSTRKNEYRFCVSLNKKYVFTSTVGCSSPNTDIVFDAPKVDSIVSGSAYFKRSFIAYGTFDMYKEIFDSLYLKP
ncbi:MAG: hypothetical protein CFE21_10665 [Bacteroidetes bacterium B1(2017)]|nr:MAG: hypothetical protein CFE21_10665 [Bacteroidetes bacterium B1(2017)]